MCKIRIIVVLLFTNPPENAKVGSFTSWSLNDTLGTRGFSRVRREL